MTDRSKRCKEISLAEHDVKTFHVSSMKNMPEMEALLQKRGGDLPTYVRNAEGMATLSVEIML